MRILELAPPWIAIPPNGYGGIEWVVHLLTEELVERGHDVTLFATGDSRTKARLEWVFETGPVTQMHQSMPYSRHVGAAFEHAAAEAAAGRPYDIIHDHTAWLALAFAPLLGSAFVHTLHGAALDQERDFFTQVRDHATFVGISAYQASRFARIDVKHVVPNAVDVSAYPFRPEKDDYLLCLGRIARDKAQGLAIEVAKRAGLPIVLAGKIDPGDPQAYFDEHILPYIDGQTVRFEGEVPDDRKRELFAGARGFVFPIQWDEPFGLVMIEAMACGTPVIASPRGAAPEVVRHGETGFLCSTIDEMVEAVARLDEISAQTCRADVEERFAPSVMADRYVEVFNGVLASG